MSKSFLVSKNMSLKYFERITPKYTMDMLEEAKQMSREALLERIKGKSGLFCTSYDKIDRELLDAAGAQLKIVSTNSVGYDHIDVEECHKRGVLIGNTPGVLTNAVAELTIAILLVTLRRLFEANKALVEGKWVRGWKPFWMCGGMVNGSVVGIIGAGRIGSAIMKRVKAFEPAQIIYANRSRSEPIEAEHGAEFTSLPDLLAKSDIVIVCCSLNASTHHLLGSEQFRQMKPTAILINTSRGAVVDQAALYQALKARVIFGAGLDVMEVEPMPTSDPLLELDNVVLIPHIGSATLQTREAMIQMAVDNLEAGLDGKPLLASV